MQPLRHGGMALATSLASALNLLLLLAALRKKLGGMDCRAMAASLGKSILSTAVMALAVLGGFAGMDPQPGTKRPPAWCSVWTLSIAAGVSIYLAASLALWKPGGARPVGSTAGSVRVR